MLHVPSHHEDGNLLFDAELNVAFEIHRMKARPHVRIQVRGLYAHRQCLVDLGAHFGLDFIGGRIGDHLADAVPQAAFRIH